MIPSGSAEKLSASKLQSASEPFPFRFPEISRLDSLLWNLTKFTPTFIRVADKGEATTRHGQIELNSQDLPNHIIINKFPD